MGIFKKLKKGFKKLGSSIAKRMRKLGRGVKKGFKSITKAFGKLGPLGHLALFFIVPYAGQALGSWMGQFGSSVMKALPKDFATLLGKVGSAVKTAASVPGNAIGSVYSTVSNALTAGIDFVTKPFMGTGSKGLATSFKDFVGNVSAKFSAPGEVPLTGPEISQVRKDSFAELTKKIDSGVPLNATEEALLREKTIADNLKISADARANSNVNQAATETGAIKPSAEKIARTEAQTAAKAETAAAKASAAKLDIAPPETITVTDTVADVADAASVDEGKSFIDSYKDFKENISKKDIIGTNISIGEAVGVGKDATGVFTAYKYFNPDDVESGFYNANIGMANALNQSTTNPYTTSGEDANFVNLNNVPNTPDQQASFYASMFGPVGNNPYAAAMNAPGYGFGFEDYITGA